jgi:hypothetical protein
MAANIQRSGIRSIETDVPSDSHSLRQGNNVDRVRLHHREQTVNIEM